MIAGLKIIELGQGIAVPLAGLRLSDLGANVTKIETHEGDFMRGAWPALPDSDVSAAFHDLNRGKTSLRLGKQPDRAKDALKKLLADADILLTDWSASDLVQIGLGAVIDDGYAPNPRLIIIDVTTWGRRGPMADQAGSELTAQAMAGYTRYLGEFGQPPRRLGSDVGSVGAGIFAAQAALALVWWRDQTGQGQVASLSILNALLSMKSIHLAAQSEPDAYLGPRIGGPNDPIEQGWKTADRPVFFAFGGSVGATGRAGWEQFVEEIGMPELLKDERFDKRGKNSTGHGPNAVRLRPEYEKGFARFSSSELVAIMHKYKANAAAYVTTAETMEHEQTRALGIVRQSLQDNKPVKIRDFPARFSDLPLNLKPQAPALGGNTLEVLGAAGFTPDEIAGLIAAEAFASTESAKREVA